MRDLGSSLGSIQDFLQALSRVASSAMTQAELGIVQDRHQQIVEFMRGRAGELADGGKPLSLLKTLLQQDSC